MRPYVIAALAVTVLNPALACEQAGPWEVRGSPEIRADSCRLTLVAEDESAPVAVSFTVGSAGYKDCSRAKAKEIWLGRCSGEGKVIFVPLNIKA
jgi:hypothetical protein